MTEDKTETRALIWFYRLRQAPLLLNCSPSETLILGNRYHTSPENCPCVPWSDCDCQCHLRGAVIREQKSQTPAP